MKKNNVLRGIFGCIYITGGIANLIVSFINVEIYRSWKDSALITPYKWFMTNIPTTLLAVVIICVAISQITIGLLILYKDVFVKLGLIGAMAFHIVIIPWGLWNLPNILFLIPLYILLKKDYPNPVIQLGKKNNVSM